MKETQGALSMLLRRYRLILGKCRWNNMMAGLVKEHGITEGNVTG